MDSDQQLATTPHVVKVSPDDVLSPNTEPRMQVFGNMYKGAIVGAWWAHVHNTVSREQARAEHWGSFIGRPLSRDEFNAVDESARKLSAITVMSYDKAAEYILGLMRGMRTVTVTMDYGTAEANVARVYSGTCSAPSTGPNYDAWWIGLERTEQRNYKRAVYARAFTPNTRGTYHYGSVKACSFWRHTRTR